MSVQVFRVGIRGVRPLICHNAGELANPLSDLARKMKELTGVRKKTDEHHRAVMQLEWVGGLYLDEKRRPIVLSVVLDGMMQEAARKHKLGKQFKAGVLAMDSPLIEHDGPKNATCDDLIDNPRFRDVRGVKVQQSRVMRTRPVFPVWALSFGVQVDPEAVKPTDLRAVLETGGRMVGLCDYRPTFGKFELVSFSQEV